LEKKSIKKCAQVVSVFMVEIVAESGDFDKFLHDVEIVSVDIF
jgi:hypothetical protein